MKLQMVWCRLLTGIVSLGIVLPVLGATALAVPTADADHHARAGGGKAVELGDD